MATHMIWVRTSPLAPTSEPAMISSELSSTNPAATAAIPDSEFSSAITTGMSAPPMGDTTSTPSTAPTATSNQSHSVLPASTTIPIPKVPAAAAAAKLTNRIPTKPDHPSTSRSLPKAMRLPVKVTAPITEASPAAADRRAESVARSAAST